MADNTFLVKLEEERPTIEQYIPSYFNKDLWWLNARNMWRIIQRDDKLRACTTESLVNCVFEAARRGLEIGTANKHCAPVAFKTTAVLLTQWQGRVFQWMKCGAIRKLKVDIAFTGDVFRVVSGDEDRIIHEPDFDAVRSVAWRNNIENIIASYAIATLWSGERAHSVCSRSYLKRIMAFIEKQKGESSFWRDWLPEQCMKTAVNRLEGKIQPPPDMTPEQIDAWQRAGRVEVQATPLSDDELPPDDLPNGEDGQDVESGPGDGGPDARADHSTTPKSQVGQPSHTPHQEDRLFSEEEWWTLSSELRGRGITLTQQAEALKALGLPDPAKMKRSQVNDFLGKLQELHQ